MTQPQAQQKQPPAPYPALPGMGTWKAPGRIYFPRDFKKPDDVYDLKQGDVVRYGDFVIRVIGSTTLGQDACIIGIQTSVVQYFVKSHVNSRIIWGPNGVAHSEQDYVAGKYLPRH